MDPTIVSTGSSTSTGAIALPVFSSFAIILLIVPFIWHFQNRNIGACSLIFYVVLLNIFTTVNAIIWPNEDYHNWWIGTGLCDVEAKFQQPLTTGLACAVTCIFRKLAHILDINNVKVSISSSSGKRKTAIDLLICFGIPALQVILHYIIQVNRYYIGAIGGCAASYDNSWPTIVIMYIWPVIFSLASCYYAAAVIARLHRHRSQFSAILASSGSSYTTSRFLRLFIMSSSLLIIYTPVSIYFFYVNLNITWIPYDWAAIHDPELWNVIIFLPIMGARTFDRWVPVALSVFVFIYFGLGGDSIDIYRRWMKTIGLQKVFPSLNAPRKSYSNSNTTSYMSRVSLISKARRYFESSRKSSSASTDATLTVAEEFYFDLEAQNKHGTVEMSVWAIQHGSVRSADGDNIFVKTNLARQVQG